MKRRHVCRPNHNKSGGLVIMSSQKKIMKYLFKTVSIMLVAVLVLLLPACSKPEPEPEPEPEETAEEEIDYSIWGDESLGIDPVVDESLRDYRCILITGIDNGHRADIQLILCINEETGESRMITVNRDTYMQVADGEKVTIDGREFEFCKCNRAFEEGDKYDLMKELNHHLDLNIKEFIGVDWPTTAKLVDDLGGVTVTVDEEMLDWINKGIGLDTYDAHDYQIESAGEQTLNGWQTVQYLRVRKYKGGNAFVREDRNRAFVESLLERAKSMSMDEISEIYDDIAGDIDTNMSRNTLTDTLALVGTSEIKNLGRFPYEYETFYEPPDKYFNYRVPQSLLSNVVKLHADMFDQFDYSPSDKVRELNDKIEDLQENYLIAKKK